MWFPEPDRRIYVDGPGNMHDPLALRQAFVEASGGMIWAFLGKRYHLYRQLNDKSIETGAEATAEFELAGIEKSLVKITRQAFASPATGDLAVDSTSDEVLDRLDHFIRWLNAKKVNTVALPES